MGLSNLPRGTYLSDIFPEIEVGLTVVFSDKVKFPAATISFIRDNGFGEIDVFVVTKIHSPFGYVVCDVTNEAHNILFAVDKRCFWDIFSPAKKLNAHTVNTVLLSPKEIYEANKTRDTCISCGQKTSPKALFTGMINYCSCIDKV